jgi:hypothetical protein
MTACAKGSNALGGRKQTIALIEPDYSIFALSAANNHIAVARYNAGAASGAPVPFTV